MKTFFSILILIVSLLYISPFYSLYKIGISVQKEDEKTLNYYMDWPSLQDSMKKDVKSFLKQREKLREKSLDNPIEGIFEDVKKVGGLLFGEKAIDIAIEKVLTPKGIFKLYKINTNMKTSKPSTNSKSETGISNNETVLEYEGYALKDFNFISISNLEANVFAANTDIYLKMKFIFPRWILYTVKSDKLTNEIAKKVEDKIDLLKNLNRKINPLKKKND